MKLDYYSTMIVKVKMRLTVDVDLKINDQASLLRLIGHDVCLAIVTLGCNIDIVLRATDA
jgi:hypothetical protein